MSVVGFRCSTDAIWFCNVSGTKIAPVIGEFGTVKLPKGYKRIEELKWLQTEMVQHISKWKPEIIGIKDTEMPARKGNGYVQRLENETTVILAAGQTGVKNFYKKVKSTIAKDLTSKGKAKYLETQLDTTSVALFDTLDPNGKEAMLVAWSLLK